MRANLPLVLGLAVLLPVLACRPRFVQREAVLKDMYALREAAFAGRPLPQVPSDPDLYGPYRPLVMHFHTHMGRLMELNAGIKDLTAGEASILKPASLADPSQRRSNHERLAKLQELIGGVAHEADLLVGSAADTVIPSLVPDEPEFAQGVLNGMAKERENLKFMVATFTRKQDYYRRIDGIVSLADAGLTGLSGEGRPMFRTPEQARTYTQKVQDLLAFERSMNEDLRKVQDYQKTIRSRVEGGQAEGSQ